jgi:mannosyltransferase OCH1-like enzyme
MIPKIIHQLWIGPHKMPAKHMQTWRDKHPTWEYRLWTEETLKPLVFVNQRLIDEMDEWCGKCDIMRYELLHRYGGVFSDADNVCLRALDEAFLAQDSFTCYENELIRGDMLANSIIACTPQNRLMELIVERLRNTPSVARHKTEQMAWQTTGPMLFTAVVKEHRYPITVYPSHYFNPVHYTGIRYEGKGPVYVTHLWGSAFGNYDQM